MKDYSIKSFLRRRSGSIVFGIAFSIIIGLMLSLASSSVNEIKQNQHDNSEKLLTVLSKIQTLQEQNIVLQQQNLELQRLSVCLLQLIKGGNFTDRQECQKRVDMFARNNGIFTEQNTFVQPTTTQPVQPSGPPDESQGIITQLGSTISQFAESVFRIGN